MKNIFIILALVFCSFQVRGQIFLSEIQDAIGNGYVPITDYDSDLATYIQKYVLLQDYLTDEIDWNITSLDLNQVLTNGNDAGGLDAINFAEVEAGEFIGDLRGAVLFKAQAGEALAKGDVVYVSGISGNTTIVSKADADDAAKMPAFGVVAASASLNNPVDIYTFGTLSNLNTSAYSLGDILYVSTSAGQLTATPPTGESALLQNIAKVTRVDNSAGSIKISGAGRTNATPNLNTGRLFVGNASNQAVADGTVYVDIANGRVGIGTSSPDYQFHQYSATGGTRTVFESGGGSGGTYSTTHAELVVDSGEGNMGIQLMGTTTSNQRILFGDTGANARGWLEYEHNTGTGEEMKFGVVGSTAMVIDDNQNVGIGTTNPSQKLEVAGNIFTTNDGTTRYIRSYRSTGVWSELSGIGLRTDGSMSLYSNDQRVNPVYIGLPNLEWTNIVHYFSGSTLWYDSDGVASTLIATLNSSGLDLTTVPTENTGDILTWGSTGLISKTTKASIIEDAGYWDRSGTTITQANLDDQVHIDGTGTELLVTGGHGASVPIADFRRDDVVDDRVYISANASEPQVSFLQGDGVAANDWAIGTGYEGSFEIADNTYLGTNTRFVIDNSGNVAIGTTSATWKLDVSTGANASQSYFGRNIVTDGIRALSTSGRTGFVAEVANAYSVIGDESLYYAMFPFDSGHNGYAYRTSVGTTLVDKFWTDYQGNGYFAGSVGIGTSSPASILEISKDNGATFSITNSTVGSGIFNAGDIMGTIDFRTDDGSTSELVRGRIEVLNETGTGLNYPAYTGMAFSTTNLNTLSEVMRLTYDGNVGIGTSTPSQKFEVDGEALIGNTGTAGHSGVTFQNSSDAGTWKIGTVSNYLRIANSGNANAYFNLRYNGNEARLGLNTVTSGKVMHVKTGGNDAFVINATTGKVGIGTASPDFKFHISDAAPYFRITNTAAPLDEKNWDFNAGTDGKFRFRSITDGGVADDWMIVDRTLGVPSEVEFHPQVQLLTLNSSSSDNILVQTSGIIQQRTLSDIGDEIDLNLGDDNLTVTTAAIRTLDVSNSNRFSFVGSQQNITISDEGYLGVNYDFPNRVMQALSKTNSFQETFLIQQTGSTGVAEIRIAHTQSQTDFAALSIGMSSTGATYIQNNKTDTNAGLNLTTVSTTGDIKLRTQSTDRVIVDQDGNVGIGLTNPDRTLEITNTGSAYEAALEINSNSDAANWARLDLRNVHAPNGGFIFYQDNGGKAGIRNLSTDRITYTIDDASGLHAWNIGASTEVMRLNSTGLGIGTNSPSAKFHVLESVSGDVAIFENSSTNQSSIRINGDNTAVDYLRFLVDSDNNYSYFIRGSDITVHYDNVNTYIWRNNAGTEQMRLNSTGLGIGTNSPAKQLEIENTGADATMIVQTTDDYNAYIEYQNNSGGGGLNYRTGVTTLEHWDISSSGQTLLRLDRATLQNTSFVDFNVTDGSTSMQLNEDGLLTADGTLKFVNATGAYTTTYATGSIAAAFSAQTTIAGFDYFMLAGGTLEAAKDQDYFELKYQDHDGTTHSSFTWDAEWRFYEDGYFHTDAGIVHLNDEDTFFKFTSNKIQTYAGSSASPKATYNVSGVTFNEGGVSSNDFRVNGTISYMIFGDAGLNRVGIFEGSPSAELDVVGDTELNGSLIVDNGVIDADAITNNISMNSPTVTVGDNTTIQLESNIGYNTIQFNGNSLRFSNGTTEHLSILSDGDLNWSGRAVGELFSNSDNTTSTTYSKIDFTVEVMDLGDATPSTANDDIELNSNGYYNVEIVGFFWNNGDSSTECEVALFRDTTEEASVAPVGSKFTNIIYKSPNPTTLMTKKLMFITALQNLSVQFKRVSGTGTCHCEDVRLHVSRVGLLD